MKNPAHPGEVRHKVWRWLLEPTSSDDPVWTERARAYWELQQETYGLRFDAISVLIDFDERRVITAARVSEVLPGERVSGYVAPRARLQ